MTPTTPQNQKFKKFQKSYKEASNKKVQNKLQLELKNIKNDIFENFKTQKLPQKHKKNIKKSCKKASNENIQKKHNFQRSKIFRITFLKT